MPLGDKLRDEIIESQKAQNDLVKWKLILIAAIGGAGLGVVPKAPKNAALLLALIPFVCIYVDAACFHAEIRIMTIARYIRSSVGRALAEERAYEAYCERHRTHFALISVALLGASASVSALVWAIGFSREMRDLLDISNAGPLPEALQLSGELGVFLSMALYFFCRNRTKWLDQERPNMDMPFVARFFLSSALKPRPPRDTESGTDSETVRRSR